MKNATIKKRRAAGLCVQCGKVQTNAWRCEGCNRINTGRIKALRKKRKSAGNCMYCDSPATVKGFCDIHRERNNRAARRCYLRKALQKD